MHGARTLAGVFASSLLLSASLARADEAMPQPPPVAAETNQEAEPAQDAQPTQDNARSIDDMTWFGMGFESRQERFRRDMGGPAGQRGGGGNGGGAGAGGNGFGR